MADLKINGGPTVANDLAAKSKPKTITLTFGDEDSSLYEEILADAKADRRSPSSFLVIYLAGNYTASETK